MPRAFACTRCSGGIITPLDLKYIPGIYIFVYAFYPYSIAPPGDDMRYCSVSYRGAGVTIKIGTLCIRWQVCLLSRYSLVPMCVVCLEI